MVTINNLELLKGMRDTAKIQNFEAVPSNLASSVVPVMEVNPKSLRRINIVRGGTSSTSSSTASVYTTPTDKDFFLTSISYFIIKDAASDNAANTVLINVDGTGDQVILSVPSITLTAMSYGTSLSLPLPIKLARGTTIRMSSSFTVGVLIRGLTITGYTVED